jgi:hypothetical protein
VTAVPAVHGPEDAERDADGFVNCEVIGFVLSGPDLPAIYVSGDNASIGTVAEITRRTHVSAPEIWSPRLPASLSTRPQ